MLRRLPVRYKRTVARGGGRRQQRQKRHKPRFNRRSRRFSGRTKYYRSRMDQKRAILDVVSRKKSVHMSSMCYKAATDEKQASTELGPIVIKGPRTEPLAMLFKPTAISAAAGRSVEDPYIVGAKELVTLSSNDSAVWEWRRVCFTSRSLGGLLKSASLFEQKVDGTQHRPVEDLGKDTATVYRALFQGEQGKHWSDPMLAVVDKTNVDLKMDKTRTYRAASHGIHARVPIWHEMRKTMVYVDDANAVTTKEGMADYYILDMVKPSRSVTKDDKLYFSVDCTTYWHER